MSLRSPSPLAVSHRFRLHIVQIIAKLLPYPAGLIASLFTNNAKKWRDLVKQLELAATLFFWWLAIEISFLPTMTNHQSGGKTVQYWQRNMNKVLIACLVAAILNLVEKIIIQLIAISFHQRTYEDRIELNKFQIGSLVKLYTFSKVKLREVEDSEFEDPATRPGSGARTPGAILEKAQKNTKKAINHVGDFTGKIAGDFTGRAVKQSTHPSQVVITLLATTSGSQLLARRLYRTFKREETETVHQEDLTAAFENADECEAAFGMFDKDMNGDISMEELEAVCVEIGRERKAITASLKDLDSVVSKLDNVFMFVVFVIAILVLIALISSAAAAGLSNAGSVVLGLSWLFSATATEFLQSLIFVFVKHPFDVGDRITIYGQTGASYKGDDYFVKEIALLYTEFKKMEGHVVQAPNSYLNTLFILNMRRSGGLAEAVPMTFKFGTTIEQIDLLRTKLLDFVKSEKREYQANILTELRDVHEAHSISLNIVFFFKSNWQNELLRLQRRNKFICALMIAIQECGIEGPRMRYPGQKDTFPLYMQNIPFAPDMRGRGGDPDNPDGRHPEDTAFASEADGGARFSPSRDDRRQSISSHIGERASSIAARSTDGPRKRSESIAQQARRLDFSLGISEIASGDHAGDVYDMLTPARQRIPVNVRSTSQSQSQARRPSQARQSYDVGRSTSRSNPPAPGLILRSHTEGPRASTSVHRNRFFSRASRELPRLELDRMEAGMAGIPEADSANTGRIDPRTGLVSPMAVRLDTTDAFAPGASTTEQTLQAFPSSSTQNRVSFEESHGRKSMS